MLKLYEYRTEVWWYVQEVMSFYKFSTLVLERIDKSSPVYGCFSTEFDLIGEPDPRYDFGVKSLLLNETHTLLASVLNANANSDLLLLVHDLASSYNWSEEVKQSRIINFPYLVIDSRYHYIISPPCTKKQLDKVWGATNSIICDLLYIVDSKKAPLEFSEPPQGLEYTEHVEDIARGVIAVFVGAFDGMGYLLLPVQHDRFETLFSDLLKQSSFSGRKS